MELTVQERVLSKGEEDMGLKEMISFTEILEMAKRDQDTLSGAGRLNRQGGSTRSHQWNRDRNKEKKK